MKLTKKQQEILDALRSNPLSWVGSDYRSKKRITLPLDSPQLFANGWIHENTFNALYLKRILGHRKLSDEQVAEWNRRKQHLTKSSDHVTPSFGFVLLDEHRDNEG